VQVNTEATRELYIDAVQTYPRSQEGILRFKKRGRATQTTGLCVVIKSVENRHRARLSAPINAAATLPVVFATANSLDHVMSVRPRVVIATPRLVHFLTSLGMRLGDAKARTGTFS